MPDRSDRSTAEPLEFVEATKRYPGAPKPAVDKLSTLQFVNTID